MNVTRLVINDLTGICMDDRMEIDGDYNGSQQKSTTDDIGQRNLPVQEYPAIPQKIANYPPIYHEDVHPAAYPSTNPNLVNWLPGSSSSSAAGRNPVFNPISTSMAINTAGFNQLAKTYREKPMTNTTVCHGYGLYSSTNPQPWEYGRKYARVTTGTTAKGDYEPSAPLIDEEWSSSNTTYEGERWSQDESLESSSSRYATSSSRPESAAYQSYHARNIILSMSETDALSLKSCTPGPELSQMSNTSPSLESEIGHPEGCKDGRSRNAVDALLSSSTELKHRKSSHVPDLGLDKSRPGSPLVQGSKGMNLDHESNLQNFDHPPVMESTNCRPARSTEDTEFLTSSSGAKLFQLMDVRSDRQDLRYVEKIILPRGQIFSFCKELDAESTRESQEGELSITFEKLDRSCLHVVGFYGNKDRLVKCFRCCNTIAPDDQVYSKMQDDSLFPGLYAVLAKDKKTLFVFYWHHGRALPNASRRDISCNFVRYLVDLCDSVFILLEGSQETIREGLQKGKISGAVRKNRKRELRIERLQATEDMVEFLPGFSLSVNTRPSNGLLTNFRMCDGSRCGILSHTRVPPQQFWRRQEIHMRLQEVSAEAQLFDGKFVHLSSNELQGEDLSIFLQCSGCSVGKEYVRLLEEHEQRKDAFLRRNERDKENRLMNYEGDIVKAVTKFISEYLKAAQVFTWEEALHANASVEVLQGMLLSAQEHMQGKKIPQNNQGNLFTKGIRVAGQVVGQLTGFGNVAELQDSQIGSRYRFPTLDTLASEIFTGFGKLNRVPNRFIFRSNRIIIRPLHLQDPSPQGYTVEHAPNTNGTPGEKRSHSGPLCFNEHLLLRPLRSRGLQMKEMVFWVKDRKFDGPLLTNTRVFSRSPKGMVTEYELKVVEDEFALGGLQDWVAFEADEILPQLKKKASLLSYVGVAGTQLQDEFVYQVLQLQDTEFLEALLKGQSQDVADEIRARWGETCTSSVAAGILTENIVHQCKAVYTRAREQLFRTFQNWFKRYMRELLEIWIQLEDSESRKVLEEDLEEERRKYLQKVRQNRTLGNQSGIKLRSCYLIPNADRGTKSHLLVSKLLTDSRFRNSTLVVTYEEEVSEMETERLLIVSLDPSTEILLMLTFLKTGQYLAFILTTKEDEGHCHIFFIPTPGKRLSVHRFKHGHDQIAFDDQTRFLALYDEGRALIQIYRFEDSYKQLDFCGAEVALSVLGAGSVTWMKFIPGRGELVFVDSAHKVYVFEMTARMVRASEIQLPGPFLKAEVTRQGPCLLVFNGPATQVESHSRDTTATTPLKIEIYWIDHSMAYIRTMSIRIPTCQWDALLNRHLETAMRSFGSQEHLLLFIGGEGIISHCLKITSASEEYRLFSDGASKAGGSQQLGSGLALDYLYHIKLQNEKGNNFHRLDKRCRVHELSEVHLILAHIAHSVSESEKHNLGIRTRSMGGWIRQLLCLVPIQIARAENNCLRPLADGLELSADVDYDNTISLASLLRFGFYDTVFTSWRNKPVKIISSMGKQSSGKSYLLNHLSGSLLDVSGGRCTNGVWMTVRFDDSSANENACMYLLLDFEGVGTFERSEQEDMLLSVLNAAVSNITIYNKKDFNIDRETETMFERFQSGVS
ncbi:hypothetical protein R1flu_007208 [Riccia fluitans]|uniref:VLIG-type G domain-containing protein n=1 Tax=Riccia fluitans TaxID=41844 RepID=A0ABD1YZB3_9MARC